MKELHDDDDDGVVEGVVVQQQPSQPLVFREELGRECAFRGRLGDQLEHELGNPRASQRYMEPERKITFSELLLRKIFPNFTFLMTSTGVGTGTFTGT